MTHEELHQIEEALQLAHQLEVEATLRGQQRLIERQAKAKVIADTGKAKLTTPYQLMQECSTLTIGNMLSRHKLSMTRSLSLPTQCRGKS